MPLHQLAESSTATCVLFGEHTPKNETTLKNCWKGLSPTVLRSLIRGWREKPNDCWEYLGHHNPVTGRPETGYALSENPSRTTTTTTARYVYTALWGDPGSLEVDHICENSKCINPRHLQALDQAENSLYTRREYCRRGHEYTEENTYVHKRTEGGFRRQCKKCVALKRRESRKKKSSLSP